MIAIARTLFTSSAFVATLFSTGHALAEDVDPENMDWLTYTYYIRDSTSHCLKRDINSWDMHNSCDTKINVSCNIGDDMVEVYVADPFTTLRVSSRCVFADYCPYPYVSSNNFLYCTNADGSRITDRLSFDLIGKEDSVIKDENIDPQSAWAQTAISDVNLSAESAWVATDVPPDGAAMNESVAIDLSVPDATKMSELDRIYNDKSADQCVNIIFLTSGAMTRRVFKNVCAHYDVTVYWRSCMGICATGCATNISVDGTYPLPMEQGSVDYAVCEKGYYVTGLDQECRQ